MNRTELDSIDQTYRLLLRGIGHEQVNDDNVDALIKRAEADGYVLLATELREWQAPCVAETKR
ncbi:MAG TPA: hypothetical protein VGM81_18495 [Burkholderiaceae bacterium]